MKVSNQCFVLSESCVEILRSLVEEGDLSCDAVYNVQDVGVNGLFKVRYLELKLVDAGIDRSTVAGCRTRSNSTNAAVVPVVAIIQV